MKIFIYLFIISFTYSSNLLLNVHSLKMNFKQVIYYENNKKISHYGVLYIKKPFFVKWEYKKPIQRNIYINNKQIMIDEPELEQVNIMASKNKLQMLQVFTMAKKIKKNTYKSIFNGTKYIITYKNKLINKIYFKDRLENKVVITFSKHRKNINIKNSFFKFSIPHYYDILE